MDGVERSKSLSRKELRCAKKYVVVDGDEVDARELIPHLRLGFGSCGCSGKGDLRSRKCARDEVVGATRIEELDECRRLRFSDHQLDQC